jgi:GntR family transcriptional regulator, histidine utilization repressor
VTTTYKDIKTDILKKIHLGEWQPGSLVPSEQDLAAGYGSARATVSRALRELVEEGIVERKRKAGTRVRLSPVRQVRFEIPLVRKEIEEQGATYRYALVRSEILVPEDWQRARFNLRSGSEAIHLICMHFSDGRPYQLEDRWISLHAVPDARNIDFSVVSPNEWLVQQVPFSTVEISFSATAADQEQALLLNSVVGDALFRIERQTSWQDEVVTYVSLIYQRDHRMTTRY